jgi:hypothetical protein
VVASYVIPAAVAGVIEDEGISGSCISNEIVHGPKDIFLGWPVFSARVLLLVGHHKDILFAIAEEVYDRDRLKGENAVESTLSPPIRVAFISFASFNGPARGLRRLPGSEPSGQSK